LTNRIISVHRGVFGFGLESAEEASEGHSVLDRWSRTHANLGALFKLKWFGNISIISGTIQIDQCKVMCLLQVPWSLIPTFIFSI